MGELTGRLIAVVDDDSAIRDSMKELLESAGLRACVLDSAEELLANLDEIGCDCIVLDINLSGMDGIEAAGILARHPKSPRVILMTGHTELVMKARSAEIGAFAVFEKPLNGEVLLDTVRRAVGSNQCLTEHG